MPRDNGFVEYLLELMQPLPGITAKRMFGGYGIFRDGLMFGLVSGDTLYFKVDDQTLPEFINRDLEPFVYVKDGKPMSMSYYQAPGEALDNSDDMCLWAEQAYAAAVRAQATKKPAKRTKKQ